MAYAIIGISLIVFVQAKDVYPQLLLARIFFALGGAGASTMVTAILPAMTAPHDEEPPATGSPSDEDGNAARGQYTDIEPPATPHRGSLMKKTKTSSQASPTRLAGFAGLFTGCGALLAVAVFLRLPEMIQRPGHSPKQALSLSYYIVGAISLTLSITCFFGLRNLYGEKTKRWSNILRENGEKSDHDAMNQPRGFRLLNSLQLGFSNPLLGLGYLGGFVARASSVGITLFIPLLVNAYFISSGLCDQSDGDPKNIKEHCRDAYVLAAELTGVSQTAALVFAPVFGYIADRYSRFNAPLLVAAIVGIVGYIALGSLNSPKASGPDGTPFIFVIMVLLGISQIGAIVCSLGLVGRCVLGLRADAVQEPHVHNEDDSRISNLADGQVCRDDEAAPLVSKGPGFHSHEHLKGSIAGMYSLAGGIGILLLTKIGGLLFDRVTTSAPFYILAAFNGFLLVGGVVVSKLQ